MRLTARIQRARPPLAGKRDARRTAGPALRSPCRPRTRQETPRPPCRDRFRAARCPGCRAPSARPRVGMPVAMRGPLIEYATSTGLAAARLLAPPPNTRRRAPRSGRRPCLVDDRAALTTVATAKRIALEGRVCRPFECDAFHGELVGNGVECSGGAVVNEQEPAPQSRTMAASCSRWRTGPEGRRRRQSEGPPT